MLPINYVAVLAAAVAAFIIGFLINGPIAGKLRTRLAKDGSAGNEEMSGLLGKMAWNMLANIITAYALAAVYLFASTSAYNRPGIATGVLCGLLVWFGFLATATSIEVIWVGKPYKLWLLECASSFIVMLAMGAIIAAFS